MKEIKTNQTKTYIVRRAFDEYRPGDEFIPTGAKNDKLIIELYCDIVYNETEQTVARTKRRTGGTKK